MPPSQRLQQHTFRNRGRCNFSFTISAVSSFILHIFFASSHSFSSNFIIISFSASTPISFAFAVAAREKSPSPSPELEKLRKFNLKSPIFQTKFALD
ncbi:hypothetical protein Nepgr_017330 [Nepenthes gracilis]|uniref:Transmembrane protein n=1 Tax=Nepenthes gracilis TaxID=150966 RepID=A0AAD3SRF6_NEPGR|nr:hypothetical protein Nepgr_017330 [Nepenthes gracilis]